MQDFVILQKVVSEVTSYERTNPNYEFLTNSLMSECHDKIKDYYTTIHSLYYLAHYHISLKEHGTYSERDPW
jgi:hypothetical protein